MYIGVDGCSAGWIAVCFDEDSYEGAGLYESIQELWMNYGDAAELILIDVPIGLRCSVESAASGGVGGI